jgi:outer membrane protein OmpA-like peptidoglycan-associated protein
MELINGRTRADWARYDGTHKIVAILLAILLAILWFIGKGPGSAATCCGAAAVATPPPAITATPTPAPTAAPVDIRIANESGKITLTGVVPDEAARKTLVDQATAAAGTGNVVDQLTVMKNAGMFAATAKLADLFGWVNGAPGNAVVAKANAITLLGTVPAEPDKQMRGEWAATMFSGARIDNQIVVKGAAPASSSTLIMPLAAKLYFETAKTDLPADADATIAQVIAFAKATPAARVSISGFHDPRGNKAMNEELAKNRAKSVKALVMKAGIAEDRINMQKPAETTGSGDNKEARRVEVSIEL